MDKESVVASLARNKKIAVETMAGQKVHHRTHFTYK